MVKRTKDEVEKIVDATMVDNNEQGSILENIPEGVFEGGEKEGEKSVVGLSKPGGSGLGVEVAETGDLPSGLRVYSSTPPGVRRTGDDGGVVGPAATEKK